MKYPSSLWLCSLFAFLSITYAVTVEPPSSDICDIQAWVRAPDLDPGEVIPGQVKIKTNGSCNSISEYSLILRFKERIWAKIPKPDVILPEKPLRFNSTYSNVSVADWRVEWNSVLGAGFRSIGFSQDSSREEYVKKMRDPTLWVNAEEERIAFETRHKLSDGSPQSEIRSTHDFALLVPTTNYPPSYDQTASFSDNIPQAERGNEHIYLYTVELKFDNGTIIEVPAGYSPFNTVDSNSLHNDTTEVVSFTANFKEIDYGSQTGLVHLETPLNISSNIDVTLPRGLHLEQGSTLNLTFTSSDKLQGVPDTDQVDHTVILRPPDVNLRLESKGHHRRVQMLFPELSVPAEIRSSSYVRCQHSPTSNDSEHFQLCGSHLFEDAVQKPDWNTTTSVSLEIPKAVLPSFDMYYQSIEAKIGITLYLRYVRTQDLLDYDENYPWISTMQTSQVESSKFFGTFLKEIPVTIHPRTRKSDFQVTHYLSPDARQPIFVDPCTVDKLSRLSVEERDLLAPQSEPVIKKGTVNGDDKVVRIRYNPHYYYYVGNTWQRKVLNSGLKVNLGENSRCAFFTHAQAQAGFMV